MKKTVDRSISEYNVRLLKRVYWNLLNFWAWYFPWKRIRVFFHRLKGIEIGKNVEIGYMVFLDNRYPNLLTIENDVTITSMCNILTHDLSRRRINGTESIGSVKICNGAFIGMNSTILPGITIGENCIIGSGSVVTENTTSNKIYAGNPAKFIKNT